MNIFNKISEFFWPLMEGPIPNKPMNTIIDEIVVDEDKLPKTLEYALNCFNAEEERRKTIEGKSSLFIGTISVATSIVLGTTSSIIKLKQCNFTIIILLFLLFALTIYMARTIWFSIKVLERATYNKISVEDFLMSEKGELYYKAAITKVINFTKKNSWEIDRKVEHMALAQDYFKRAIVTIVLCAIDLLLVFYFE